MPDSLRGVYPRAGGGTFQHFQSAAHGYGLSPRRRGNHRGYRPGHQPDGSIPAQAGEPRVRRSGPPPLRVYPRAGGGTGYGSSLIEHGEGLSPRRRGNRRPPPSCRSRRGSIPAQAGEPPACRGHRSPRRVYPRAGGGTSTVKPWPLHPPGLSPRRRGNRTCDDFQATGLGSIPAQAGEPARASRRTSGSRVYPRAGGGTVESVRDLRDHQGLSPRRRGNRRLAESDTVRLGSIPAQAGEPPRSGTDSS